MTAEIDNFPKGDGVSLTDEELSYILHYDPLARAEDVTGQSYKKDKGTMGLGFVLLQMRSEARNAALLARDDTLFSNTLERYVRIITEYGFRQVLDVPFTVAARHEGDTSRNEHFFVYWHDDGLLLTFDTYGEDGVNGGKVHYAWEPDDPNEMWQYTSSHDGLRDGVIVGDHDCREALLFNLEQLRAHGKFLNPWPRTPYLWLCHYGDDLGEDRYPERRERIDAIRQERLALLPASVRDAINV